MADGGQQQVAAAAAAAAEAEQQVVLVGVAQGALAGRRRRTARGFPYCSFHGIPYAAPPVGPLRFQPPQPAPAWSGVRDATKEGNMAPQVNMLTGQFAGHEDCLFLNVSTPQLPSEGPAALLPVMVMIHGGGLAVLSGNEDFFRPDFLVDKGVVYVSFNYRLGVLGFLSTGDNVVPGNMGFKDQVAALRWVKDNIASFGGDPDNVTVFGCSAGGWSCHGLVLSPLAKGLFRRAIAHSGVAVGDGVCSDSVRARSFALAAHLGLQTDDSQQLVDFLRKQPARLLAENAMFGRTAEDKARGVMFPFVGTVEPADAEGGAFFPRPPAQLLRSGEFQQVPLITGVCAHEATVFASDVVPDKARAASYAADPRLLVPTNLLCPDADRDALAEQIKRFYFGERDIGPDTEHQLYKLLGDLMFTYPAVRTARLHASRSTAAVHFYVFDYVSDNVSGGPMADMMRNIRQIYNGAGHGEDFVYICRGTFFGDPPPVDSFEDKLTDQLTRLWTNFAKTGQVTEPEGAAAWPAFVEQEEAYLRVTSGGLTTAQRPFADRVAFWEQLYARYGS